MHDAIEMPLIIASIIFVLSLLFLLVNRGWKQGLILVIYVFSCLAIYIVTHTLWGEEGKKYLAITVSVAAIIVLYLRKKSGKNIW